MDKDTSIPFDQYQRYGVAAKAINAIRSNNQPLKILEVGANTHKLLGKLLPNDRIVYLDLEVPSELQANADFIVGDATDLKLDDGSFDVVIALDVFEHIPKERRNLFLYHTSRVSSLLTLIGAPFASDTVSLAEREALEYWESLFNTTYRWLQEHAENGLPILEDAENYFSSNGYFCQTLPHGNLALWTDFIKAHFAEVYLGALQPSLSIFYKYYETVLFEKDFFHEFSYRHFLFCSRNQAITDRVSSYFEQFRNASGKFTDDSMEKLLKTLPLTASEKYQVLADKDAQLADKDAQLADKDAQILAMLNSNSWKITLPIRKFKAQINATLVLVDYIQSLISVMKHNGSFIKTVKSGFRVLKSEDWRGFLQRLLYKRSLLSVASTYIDWVQAYDSLTNFDRKILKYRLSMIKNHPLISVVMPTYNAKSEWLIDAIESVRTQIYSNWELCIADDASTNKEIRPILEEYAKKDARIKIVFREENGHISLASNSALSIAKGDYITFLDHDDLLAETALFYVAEHISKRPQDILIYSDEDKIDSNNCRCDPYFKPDWNPALFLSQNYICHLAVYKKTIVDQLGGFRVGYEGAQDFDLALRVVSTISGSQVGHIPRVLYHWRSHEGSTAYSGDVKNYALQNGVKALNDYLTSIGVKAKAELNSFGNYHVRYELPLNQPLVSLIIPTRNKYQLIKQCVESILIKTTYKNYEIIVIDNGSDEQDALNYLSEIAKLDNIRVIRDDSPFNYSALNNLAVNYANGQYVGLINNDIEIITPEWLDEMVSLAIQPNIGAVGARLWYSNNTLQHGGVVLGIGGVAGHSHKNLSKDHAGYFGRAALIQNFSAVTAACLVVSKKIYQEVGGLDEINLKVAFNDVNFCLEIREKGYKNIWTPYAELYHHESASRGYEDNPVKIERFNSEVNFMKSKWGDNLLYDPFYNPNLSLFSEDFSIASPPRQERI